MTPGRLDPVTLVVFDVDGTLYRQAPLRRRMAAELLGHALSRADLRTVRVLRRYRAVREALSDSETPEFDTRARETAARDCGCDRAMVDAAIAEWIDTRPLRHLGALRYPGLPRLFDDLRAGGRTVAVLSDFPVGGKLAALGLAADIAVAATDPEVGLAKPHPRGLEQAMARAGARPETTLMIGDRWERDGLAAERAGVAVLIRSERALPEGQPRLPGFDDPVLAPLRGRAAA